MGPVSDERSVLEGSGTGGLSPVSELCRDHDIATMEALMAVIGYVLRDLVVAAQTRKSLSSSSSSSSSSSPPSPPQSSLFPSTSRIRPSSSTPPSAPPHQPLYHSAFDSSQQRICTILQQAVFNILKCYSINWYVRDGVNKLLVAELPLYNYPTLKVSLIE